MAEIGNLSVQIGLDGAEFSRSVKEINGNLRLLESEFKAATVGVDKFSNNLEDLGNKQAFLTDKLGLQKEKVEQLKKEFNTLANSTSASSKEIQKAQTAYNNAISVMAKTENQLKAVTNQLETQSTVWGRMGSNLGQVGVRMQEMGGRMQSAGQDIATSFGVATAAIGVGLASSVKSAADFEAQLSSIKAVSGATGNEMETLSSIAVEYGSKTKYSSLEAAQGIEELIKAGVSIKDIINGGLEGALSLATAGELELAEAAEIASTALNAFKSDGLDVSRAADLLAGGANASATSVGELKFGLSQVSAVAAGLGLSFKDTTTALSLFANSGLKGSDAGTSLKTMLSNLIPKSNDAWKTFESLGLITFDTAAGMKFLAENGVTPVSDSMGDVEEAIKSYIMQTKGIKKWNKDAEDTFKDLGKSTGFVNNAFFDSKGNVEDMTVISGELQKALKGLTAEQRQQALYAMFGSDAIRAANILYKEGAEGMTKMYQEMSKVTAVDVATERMNNFKGKMEELKGSIETAKISLGDALIPAITSFTKALQSLVDGFNNLSPGMQKTIAIGLGLTTVVLGIVTTLGLVLTVVGGAVSGIGALAGVFGTVSTAIAAAGGMSAVFATAMAAITGPVGITIAAVVGLIAIFTALYKNNETFRNKVQEIWSSIQKSFDTALKFISKIVRTVLNEVHKTTGELLGKIKGFWDENGKKITAIVKFFMNEIGGHIKMVMGIIKGVFEVVWPIIASVVKVVWESIKLTIKNTLDIILGIIQFWIKIFTGDWKGAFNTIKETATKIMNNIIETFKNINLKEIGKNIIQGLIDGIGSMINAVTERVKGIATNIKDTIKEALDINSPSRVMRDEVGKWIPAGIAEGIHGNMAVINKASRSMEEASMPNLKPVNSTTSNNFSFEGMLAGANFHVRNEYDIPKIAREIGNYVKLNARKGGVIM